MREARSVMKTFNGSINDRDTDQALPAEALQKPIHPSMSTMRERTYNLSPRASSTREENIPHPGSDDHGRRFFFFFFFASFFFLSLCLPLFFSLEPYPRTLSCSSTTRTNLEPRARFSYGKSYVRLSYNGQLKRVGI